MEIMAFRKGYEDAIAFKKRNHSQFYTPQSSASYTCGYNQGRRDRIVLGTVFTLLAISFLFFCIVSVI